MENCTINLELLKALEELLEELYIQGYANRIPDNMLQYSAIAKAQEIVKEIKDLK